MASEPLGKPNKILDQRATLWWTSVQSRVSSIIPVRFLVQKLEFMFVSAGIDEPPSFRVQSFGSDLTLLFFSIKKESKK